MEDKCLQSVDKPENSKKVKEMENKFFQSLRVFSKRGAINLEEKSKEELIEYIRKTCNYKKQIAILFEAVYLAVQEMYWEKFIIEGHQTFPLLEGNITFRTITEVNKGGEVDEKDLYIFTPNEKLKKLFDSTDEKGTTNLKKGLESRFYKMIEHLYRIGEEKK